MEGKGRGKDERMEGKGMGKLFNRIMVKCWMNGRLRDEVKAF